MFVIVKLYREINQIMCNFTNKKCSIIMYVYNYIVACLFLFKKMLVSFSYAIFLIFIIIIIVLQLCLFSSITSVNTHQFKVLIKHILLFIKTIRNLYYFFKFNNSLKNDNKFTFFCL